MTYEPPQTDVDTEFGENSFGLFGDDLPYAPIGWSINRLAKELGMDRRTITKRLQNVHPMGRNSNGPVYRLADAVRAIFEQPTASETDQLNARILRARAESAEIDLERTKDNLLVAKDVEKAAFDVARAEREVLHNWPDRVAPILAAEFGINQVGLATALEREIRIFMEERSDDAGGG